MLIGVDCRKLSDTEKTGTHNYLIYVLKNLSSIDKENRYFLYFSKAPNALLLNEITSGNPLWEVKILSCTKGWTQITLSKTTFTDKPDVLFCSWHTMPIIHNPKTRIVSVIHDLSPKRLKVAPIYWTAVLSDSVIAVSEATKTKLLQSIPFVKSKTVVIYEGVDTHVYKRQSKERIDIVKEKYDISSEYFLSVGTLNDRKNIKNMLLAFDMLCQRDSKAYKYVLVGSCSSEYEEVFSFTKKLSCYQQVVFTGRLDEDEVLSLYSGALSLLYVSKEEGFGLPILEAFSIGCPVITSNISSMKEIGGEAVAYASPTDVASIYTQMRSLIDNSFHRNSLISLGIDRVKLYSWDTSSRKLLMLLNSYNH